MAGEDKDATDSGEAVAPGVASSGAQRCGAAVELVASDVRSPLRDAHRQEATNLASVVLSLDHRGERPQGGKLHGGKDLLGVPQPFGSRQRLLSADAGHDGVARRSAASARTMRSDRLSPSSRLRCIWISDDAQSARRAGSSSSR